MIIHDCKHAKLEDLIRNREYVIGIKGKGTGRLRRGQKLFSIKDIKRVLFKRGEEKEAIKLFVDVNREILMSDVKFRFRNSFYPQMLYKYFYEYLTKKKLDEKIPLMPEYGIKRSRGHTKDAEFSQYMRERCSILLENSESILHDSDFVDKYYK